jgi:Rha family phage regulatory protein
MFNIATTTAAQQLTMSSKEIAELTGKEHRNVMRDIRAMLVELHGEGGVLSFEHTHRNEQNGQAYPIFNLPKRETLILVSGYSVEIRARIIDRWQELEQQQAKPPAVSELSRLDILRLAMDAEEARIKAEAERDHAVATKAQIGHQREATAMATASAANRRVERLAIELDESRKWASIKRMEMAYHGQKFDWRILKEAAAEMGIAPRKIFDANYGTVNAYHADVWSEAYAVEII